MQRLSRIGAFSEGKAEGVVWVSTEPGGGMAGRCSEDLALGLISEDLGQWGRLASSVAHLGKEKKMGRHRNPLNRGVLKLSLKGLEGTSTLSMLYRGYGKEKDVCRRSTEKRHTQRGGRPMSRRGGTLRSKNGRGSPSRAAANRDMEKEGRSTRCNSTATKGADEKEFKLEATKNLSSMENRRETYEQQEGGHRKLEKTQSYNGRESRSPPKKQLRGEDGDWQTTQILKKEEKTSQESSTGARNAAGLPGF